MKRLVNKDDPRNVLVVDHAYGSGLRSITCEAGFDSFDLWADQWTIEDLTMANLRIIPAGHNYRVTLECTEALLGYMAQGEDIRLTVYKQLKKALDAEVLRFSKGEGGSNLSAGIDG